MGAVGKFVSGKDTAIATNAKLAPPQNSGKVAMSGRMRKRIFSCPHGAKGSIKASE